MTKAEHRKFVKQIADFFAKHIPLRLNLIGLEAAVLANFGISVSRPTLDLMFEFYNHSKFLPTAIQQKHL